jgi:hypothetical protein
MTNNFQIDPDAERSGRLRSCRAIDVSGSRGSRAAGLIDQRFAGCRYRQVQREPSAPTLPWSLQPHARDARDAGLRSRYRFEVRRSSGFQDPLSRAADREILPGRLGSALGLDAAMIWARRQKRPSKRRRCGSATVVSRRYRRPHATGNAITAPIRYFVRRREYRMASRHSAVETRD